jgi:pilus assembly protein CpaB
MKLKSLILLVMSLGCGLVAMLGVQQVLSGGNTPADDKVQVLVARQEISPGVPLDEKLVGFESWPKAGVPQGAVTNPQEIEGRALRIRAYPGEVILQAKLGDKGAFGASASIEKGMRVVSVPVNMTSANSGMIRPGDRVDILVTYKVQRPGAAPLSRARTILEYIEVFAIDRDRDAEGGDAEKGAKAENLSVIVTPKQANLLMLAANKGVLQMALRHGEDKEPSKATAVDDRVFDEIETGRGLEPRQPDPPVMAKAEKPATPLKAFLEKAAAKEPVAPAKPNVWSIEIYEGETKRVEQIELGSDGKGTKIESSPVAADTTFTPNPPAAPPLEEEPADPLAEEDDLPSET